MEDTASRLVQAQGPGQADRSAMISPVSCPESPTEVTRPPATPRLYSVFSTRQKRWMVFLICGAGWFSTLSSFTFFAIITSISEALHTSISKINLTITSYLIFAGLAPSLVANFADLSGRRPCFMVQLFVYVAANVGLALQNSFAALFVLRMIQAAGVSGLYSLVYGVLADITTPAERGGYTGLVSTGVNTAPSLGPVIGAILSAEAGWRWVFWFMAILSGLVLVGIFLTLPETARTVVGNGSVPTSGIHTVPAKFMRGKSELEDQEEKPFRTRRWTIPNPLAPLKIVLKKDSAVVLLALAIMYMVYTVLQASLGTLFVKVYDFNELDSGLIYLPFGIGGLIGALVTGRILDHDYRIVAKRHGLTVEKRYGQELLNFPIEAARLRTMIFPLFLAVVLIIGYGWAIEKKVHYAVSLVIQFFTGFCLHASFVCLNVTIADINPGVVTSAQACNNLGRCLFAAGGTAAVQPLLDRIGAGWCFTIFGTILGLEIALLFYYRNVGWGWRLERDRQEKQRERRRTEHDKTDLREKGVVKENSNKDKEPLDDRRVSEKGEDVEKGRLEPISNIPNAKKEGEVGQNVGKAKLCSRGQRETDSVEHESIER